MTRKDYTVIAKIIIGQITNGYVKKKYINNIIQAAINRLELENNNFDCERFRKYIEDRVC